MNNPHVDYTISHELDRMELRLVHRWLSEDAYWALGRTWETQELASKNSLNFGVFAPTGEQVAYARVVTDSITFAWICDVYVDPEHRGRGVGRMLVDDVVSTLKPLNLRRTLLATADAHEVYERAGFTPLPEPRRFMVIARDGV